MQTCQGDDLLYKHSLLSADDLRDFFEKFGTISDATVKTDPATGRSKGFGFVTFVDSSSVDQVTHLCSREGCCQPTVHTISEINIWC